MILGGLRWLGAHARWVLAVGVVLATFLPALSAYLRPYLPGLVVLILCVSMVRLDLGVLARRASHPRRIATLLAWSTAFLVVTPVAVWAAARGASLPDAHVAALVYTFAAPPIASSPALCLMLGLNAAFALELTVALSLIMPFAGPVVTKALLGEAVPLDALEMSFRIGVIIAAGIAVAVAVRRLLGHERIARNAGALDGVATIVLLLFVIPLFDGFWEITLRQPWFALGTLGLVLVANWGVQALMAMTAARVAEPALAGAAGLMWGNRNVSIYLAVLPPDPLFILYVAFYQVPLLFTPLVMARILSRRRMG